MIKFRVDSKPCSTNVISRHFVMKNGKSASYKNQIANYFEELVKYKMIKENIRQIQFEKYEVNLFFGYSHANTDLDNLAKNAIDSITQNKKKEKIWYLIEDDNKIFKIVLEKIKVKRGDEFTEFTIKEYK
jgi:Holliday junction resolvase RusA-like endonuclease